MPKKMEGEEREDREGELGKNLFRLVGALTARIWGKAPPEGEGGNGGKEKKLSEFREEVIGIEGMFSKQEKTKR